MREAGDGADLNKAGTEQEWQSSLLLSTVSLFVLKLGTLADQAGDDGLHC
jgi:hypothetical protein